MSSLTLPGGAFSSVFVGAFGASSVLGRVSNQRTEGAEVSITTPSEYIVGTNSFELSGPTLVNLTLTFYTDKDIPGLLAKSTILNGTLDSPTDTNLKYVLLCINADPTKNSYLFTEISVIPSLTPNYSKDRPTTIKVKFQAANIDPDYSLYHIGTPTALAAILSARSPI